MLRAESCIVATRLASLPYNRTEPCHIGSPPCLHPIGPMLTPTPTQFIYIFVHPPRTLQCCPDMLLSTPLSYFYFDPADKPCTLSPVPLLPASDIGVMSAAYVDALIKAKLEPRIGYDHLDTGMMTLCQEPSSPTICLFCHLLSSCIINIISFRRNNGMTIKHWDFRNIHHFNTQTSIVR